ncbi:MAG: hypothetical protein ACI9T7_003099 [Oleiphilaceae bacterium]
MDEYEDLMQTDLSNEGSASDVITQNNDEKETVQINPKKVARLNDEQLLAKRHFSHFTPRDFDLSPYFEVVKPTLTAGFDYRDIQWSDHE